MHCQKCGKEAENGKAVCPGCGAVLSTGQANNNGAQCVKCNVARVPVKKKQGVSAIGIASVFGTLIGLIVFLAANITAGAIILVCSIIAGIVLRPESTFMVCPNCGDVGRKL